VFALIHRWLGSGTDDSNDESSEPEREWREVTERRGRTVSKVTLRLVSGKKIERYGSVKIKDDEYIVSIVDPNYYVTKSWSTFGSFVRFRGQLCSTDYRRFPKENVEWVSQDETDYEVVTKAEYEQLYEDGEKTPNYRNDEVTVEVPDPVSEQQFE